MINEQQIPVWKKALKWIVVVIISAVVLDWLLDGRLRRWLPFRRNGGHQ